MPPNTVDTAVKDIRHHMETGWFNPVTHDDINSVKSILSNLNAADTRAAVQALHALIA